MGKMDQNSETDDNRIKYYLAVKKYGRECLEEAFYLLYNTWCRGRNYETLQEFCVECLGVNRDYLAEVLCQPEIVSPQGSARSSTALPSRVHVKESRTADEERRSSGDTFYSFHSPLLPHVISSARKSFRRSQNEVTSVPQDETASSDPLWRQSLSEAQDPRGLTSFHLNDGQTQQNAHLTHTKTSCVCQNAPQKENTSARKPSRVSSSQLWARVRLLLPKPFVKKNNDSDTPLRRGSVNVISPLSPSPPAPLQSLPTQLPSQKVKTESQAPDEDVKSSEGEESYSLKQVIQETKNKLQSSFFLSDHEHKSCFLHAEPDPSRLPLSVLITLLTKVFPEITPKIRNLVHQLQRLVYVMCYEDLVFDDHQLKFWLQKLNIVISELIADIVSCCTAIIKRFIAEASEILQASKQRLQKAQTEYQKHLECVEKTREEFEVVQKELKEAQVKNSRVLRAYSRSCSQESDETHKTVPTKVGIKSLNDVKRNTNTQDDGINRTDSGHLSLAEELEGQDARMKPKDDDDDIPLSDSLLVSVMREVALIEKKHKSFRPFDKNLKMMVRKTHKSVIVTKREMRDRLNSNVSAEESAMSKEEVLSRSQMKTRLLSRDVKKLRRNLKDLQSDQKAIMLRISHDLETLEEDELDETTRREGWFGIGHLREGSGRLLRESRREAKGFASGAKIMDLGEWLVRQRYATMPLRQVYSYVRVADTKDSVPITDLVGPGHQRPPIIILSGPKGSGKTCMAYYLLHQWHENTEAIKSSIHEFDLVTYGKASSILSSGSWAQYLREHIFCHTLVDFPEAKVCEALDAVSVLSILDMDIDTTSLTTILKDVFGNLGNNKQVVLITRPDGENDIVAAAKRHSIKFLRVRMCPMTSSAIQEFSKSLISLFERDESVISSTANKFSRLVSSMAVTEEVLYPLPIAYLLYLWRTNPRHAMQATTLSRLISQVIIVAESTLVEALVAAGQYERGVARAKAEKCTHQLCEAAWRLLSGQGWPHDCHFLLESENISLTDPVETSSYSILIMVKESADGNHRANFLHLSIAEILCGFFLTQQWLLQKGATMLRRREKLEKYCVPEITRYREVLIHMAGALVYNTHKLEDAKEIASLFFSSLVDKQDMIAWRGLLRECDFLSTMCIAVSSLLSSYGSWTVANHSQETNCALADLLKKEAYRPNTVIISHGGKLGCKSGCVVRALATCSSTLVHIRQESQFYAWGEPATCDALILPLQPPGTLQECWGHVGVEGALALRHCHQLKELNVRVSSCEALTALTYSIEHIARGLRYLYLRLDLPTHTPVPDIQPLNFKGKSLWLRMRGVEDASLDWAKQVIRKLNDWYTEVLLEKSNLSPSALHELKEFLPNTPVHISY
ncbi:uncharacterized protein LOC127008160 [Eriocheir sinensis]|uniref:uncharacterized protein LOC127008160 n=1 Tax=Eriocheir sinensis TaxID=95602 RepID=UPI0021CAC9BA|nr:uncharacterized protein LOC127008160 [Eriocheir sinensis]